MALQKSCVEGPVTLVLENSLTGVVVVYLDNRLGPLQYIDPERVGIETSVEYLQQERGELLILHVPRDGLVEVVGSCRVRYLHVVLLVPYRDLWGLVYVDLLEVELQNVLVDHLQHAVHLGLGHGPNLYALGSSCQVVGRGECEDWVEYIAASVESVAAR